MSNTAKAGSKFDKEKVLKLKQFGFALILGVVIASILAMIYGYKPTQMFYHLFKGSLVGKYNIGTMLEKFTTILLLGSAFNLGIKVGFFNLGLEGSFYLGALSYAVIGYQFPSLPGIIYVPICIMTSMIFGAAWGFLPAFLKTKFKVNEVCVTLLLNYVVTLFCTYGVFYVWNAKTSLPQTPKLCPQVTFGKILPPSRASAALFVAILVYVAIYIFVYKTKTGFKVQSVGQNEHFAAYAGVKTDRTVILTVMATGAIAGLAGGMEVAGLYGRFLDEFAIGQSFNGLLASRLVSNSLPLLPVSSLALAILQAGAYGVERGAGIPRTFIDCFTTILIMLITMEGLYEKVVNGCKLLVGKVTGKSGKTAQKAGKE